MDNKGFREFDLTTRKIKYIRRNPAGYSDGRGSGHFDERNRIFYYTENDLWAISVNKQGVAGAAKKLTDQFNGYFVQNTTTGVLWSWDCVTRIKSYDPATGKTVQHTPAGVQPLNHKRRVCSKHFIVEELGVLACIDEPSKGLYIYNPSNGPFDGEAQVVPDVDSSVPQTVVYHETFESPTWYTN